MSGKKAEFTLGDPGAVSQVGRNGATSLATKVFDLAACSRVLAEDDVYADHCN